MNKEELTKYFTEKLNKDKFYEKVRKALAEKISKDPNFIEDYMSVIEKLRSADSTFNNMINDAESAKIDIKELDAFPDTWVSYIIKLN